MAGHTAEEIGDVQRTIRQTTKWVANFMIVFVIVFQDYRGDR